MDSTKTFCWICFITDQKLEALDEKWSINCFQNILGYQLMSSEIKHIILCINCKALLRKYNKFRQQIRNSYKILSDHQNLDITLLKQPLKLKSADQFNIIINPDGTWKDFLQTDIKQETHIKKELSDTFATSDTDNDTPVVKIKKKQKRKKKKRTPIVFKEVELSEIEAKKERELLACQEEFVNAILKCNFCIVTFANQADLNEHRDKKHDKNLPFKCSLCSCGFTNEVRFAYHRNKHIRRFECTVCLKRFTTQNSAIKHYFINHNIGSNILQEAPPADINIGKIEVNVDTFKCDICPKEFKFRSSLRKHMDSHMVASGRKRKPTCEPCGLSFTNTANLQKHLKTSSKHQIQLKLKKLESQSKETKIEELKISINKNNMYRCEYCDKSFQWKGNLSRHIRSHIAKANGELSCVPCARVFSSIATYQQHMKLSRKHISENDFKYMCSDCGCKFVSKTKLTDHINWEHLKKYQHVCSECNKIFRSHTSLYVHIQFVHKKSKEYLCDLCGKSFPMKSKLVGHIQAIHHRSPHSCEQCGANFAWSSCLSRHTTHVHKKNV